MPLRSILLALSALALSAFAAPQTSMEISSNDFSNGGTIPPRHSCAGTNDSPSLRFRNLPAATKSLVLIMDDPDAQKGTFTHWVVWDIAPTTLDFSTGSTPPGVVVGTNDAGKTEYVGPCPPSGQHRYYFRLFALDVDLNLPTSTRRLELEARIKGHVLAEATLLGRFGHANAAPSP